jgi:diguanylate cyclase
MGAVDLLSETMIEILKEFSIEKRVLTSAALREALSTRQELLSLFDSAPAVSGNGGANGASVAVENLPIAFNEELENQDESNLEPLCCFKKSLLKILDSVSPMIMGGFEERFNEFRRKLDACKSLDSLTRAGDELSRVMCEVIVDSSERINITNDFLVKLSDDLFRMEEKLFSYQDYHKRSHEINNQFHCALMNQTDDVHRVFNSLDIRHDIHSIISSKLNLISQAIEDKNKQDEARHHEADCKIIELQNDLKAYENEIVLVRERTESLEKEVLLDELTQINNRRAYDLQIKESLKNFHRNGRQFSLILIDIDHFKRVNDNYGHKVGDSCLKEVAQLVKSCVRKIDFLARYGGEELIIILDGSNALDARNVAEKIRGRIEKARFHFQNESISVTISAGVTEVVPSDGDPDFPFSRVDEALYRAKEQGRNKVRVVTDLSYRRLPASDPGPVTRDDGVN